MNTENPSRFWIGAPIVANVFAATPMVAPFTSFLESLRAHPSLDLIGSATTGHATVEALRTNRIDAIIFADAYADLARVVRVSARPPADGWPSMVLAASERSESVVIRSSLYGFDEVIALNEDPSVNLQRIADTCDGGGRLASQTSLEQLGVPHGLLVRDLVAPEERDRDVADLVGVGLDDQAISKVMSIPLQEVRNRIETLLTINGLPSRTHLAVLRAGRVTIPDFV